MVFLLDACLLDACLLDVCLLDVCLPDICLFPRDNEHCGMRFQRLRACCCGAERRILGVRSCRMWPVRRINGRVALPVREIVRPAEAACQFYDPIHLSSRMSVQPAEPMSGLVTDPMSGLVTDLMSGLVTDLMSGLVTDLMSGLVTDLMSVAIKGLAPG